MTQDTPSRREVLKGLAQGSLVGLAGCREEARESLDGEIDVCADENESEVHVLEVYENQPLNLSEMDGVDSVGGDPDRKVSLSYNGSEVEIEYGDRTSSVQNGDYETFDIGEGIHRYFQVTDMDGHATVSTGITDDSRNPAQDDVVNDPLCMDEK